MDAYEVMREWDRAVGAEPRSNEELDRDVPAGLGGEDYDAWKERLAAGNIKAIVKGLRLWGLPVGPLRPFEIEEFMEN